MVQRMGKRGPFLGCSGYPECKTTMNFDAEGKPVLASEPTEHVCEKCGKPMVLRKGRAARSWPAPAIRSAGTPRTWTPRATRSSRSTRASPARSAAGRWSVKKRLRGPFLGCSAYPKCRSTKPMPDGVEGEAQGRCCRRRRKKKEGPGGRGARNLPANAAAR